MTRTTTDLRRAVEGLRPGYLLIERKDVLRFLPEGDEPVYLVTASELAAALDGHVWGWLDWTYRPDAPTDRKAEALRNAADLILSRLGGEGP